MLILKVLPIRLAETVVSFSLGILEISILNTQGADVE